MRCCVGAIFFKSGAFAIKYARENGDAVDPNVDYDAYLMQMLYYIASCKSKPVHIARIRETFGIDDDTVREAYRWLVHSDAVVISLKGALDRVNRAEEFIADIDLAEVNEAFASDDFAFASCNFVVADVTTP